MLLRQFCLGSNLPTRTGENTDFLWQKPKHLQNAEAVFKG